MKINIKFTMIFYNFFDKSTISLAKNHRLKTKIISIFFSSSAGFYEKVSEKFIETEIFEKLDFTKKINLILMWLEKTFTNENKKSLQIRNNLQKMLSLIEIEYLMDIRFFMGPFKNAMGLIFNEKQLSTLEEYSEVILIPKLDKEDLTSYSRKKKVYLLVDYMKYPIKTQKYIVIGEVSVNKNKATLFSNCEIKNDDVVLFTQNMKQYTIQNISPQLNEISSKYFEYSFSLENVAWTYSDVCLVLDC